MTKFLVALCLLANLSTTFGQTPEEPYVSPLQLKSMQLRKFSKPQNSVLRAIKFALEDSGATCYLSPTYFTPDGKEISSYGSVSCNFAYPLSFAESKIRESASKKKALPPTDWAFVPFVGPLIFEYKNKGVINKNEEIYKSAEIAVQALRDRYICFADFKIEKAIGNNESVVKASLRNVSQKQFRNADTYASIFKIIGDELFVQGIPIEEITAE